MRKAQSVHSMIRFDPRQFEVGYSKVENLPRKRSSVQEGPTYRRIETQRSHRDSPLDQMRTENTRLRIQNSKLRAEVERFKMDQDKLRSQNGRLAEQITSLEREAHKKLGSSKYSSRITTECSTGLFSSKQVSQFSDAQQLINELEEAFKFSLKKPCADRLLEAMERSFAEFQSSYTKISVLFQSSLKTPIAAYEQLSQLLELYRVPILFRRDPQSLLRQLSRAKRPLQKTENPLQLLSPEETITRLEQLVGKLIKSSKLMGVLRGNLLIRRFTKKLLEE